MWLERGGRINEAVAQTLSEIKAIMHGHIEKLSFDERGCGDCALPAFLFSRSCTVQYNTYFCTANFWCIIAAFVLILTIHPSLSRRSSHPRRLPQYNLNLIPNRIAYACDPSSSSHGHLHLSAPAPLGLSRASESDIRPSILSTCDTYASSALLLDA